MYIGEERRVGCNDSGHGIRRRSAETRLAAKEVNNENHVMPDDECGAGSD